MVLVSFPELRSRGRGKIFLSVCLKECWKARRGERRGNVCCGSP